MANYPSTMPDLRAVENDPGVAYDPLQTNVVFAEDINNIAAEILAIATELGSLPKGSFADVAARLTDMTSKTATAQSTANSKGNKVTKIMRAVASTGRPSQQKTATSVAPGASVWVEDFSAGSVLSLPFNRGSSTALNGLQFIFECMIETPLYQWVEAGFFIDDVQYGGWVRIVATQSRIIPGKISFYGNVDPGDHTMKIKLRNAGSAAMDILYVSPYITIIGTVDN